jgi:hypothetical protein
VTTLNGRSPLGGVGRYGTCNIVGVIELWFWVPQCRYLIQRDWSQEDSTSNKMRMHAMILLLLSTSVSIYGHDSAGESISGKRVS